MADKNKPQPGALSNPADDIENIKRRVEMLDRRLDDIDSAVSALVERVMKQPVTFGLTCPRCGKNIEIAVIGNPKVTG